MAEEAPTPAPAPPATDNAAVLASLYQDYNPQGAMGGLFAPAYIHGLKASEDAVSAWNAQNHPVTYANIDETRMPNPYAPPSAMSKGDGVYGGPIPMTQAYGDPKGMVDPLALQSLAQGGKYDFAGRRSAIAARLAANAQAAASQPAPAPVDPTGGMRVIWD
jgi:hypothetical protein